MAFNLTDYEDFQDPGIVPRQKRMCEWCKRSAEMEYIGSYRWKGVVYDQFTCTEPCENEQKNKGSGGPTFSYERS